jgi:hypothetical protein
MYRGQENGDFVIVSSVSTINLGSLIESENWKRLGSGQSFITLRTKHRNLLTRPGKWSSRPPTEQKIVGSNTAGA